MSFRASGWVYIRSWLGSEGGGKACPLLGAIWGLAWPGQQSLPQRNVRWEEGEGKRSPGFDGMGGLGGLAAQHLHALRPCCGISSFLLVKWMQQCMEPKGSMESHNVVLYAFN